MSPFPAYSRERPPIIAASSAVLGTSASSRMDSRSACAPSPTAPIPSNVGIPRAEVKFPSEPPPVAASCKLKTQSRGHCCCAAKKSNRARSSFHRRPIQAPRDLQRASAVYRAQRPEAAIHARPIDSLGNPHVELRPGFGGHHIGSRASADHPGVDGDAPGRIGEGAGALDLAPKFQHRTVSLAEIHATVGGDAVYLQVIVGHSFSGRLVGPGQGPGRAREQTRRRISWPVTQSELENIRCLSPRRY